MRRSKPSLNPAAVEIGSGEAASQRADVALSTTGGGIVGSIRPRDWVKGGPLKLHLRPSRDHIVGDLEEPGTASASLSGVGPRSDGRGETAREGSSEPEGGSGRYGIFLTGRVVSFRWGDGAPAGAGGAHRGLRRDGGPPGDS
jgi:hypothetical protein